MGTAALLPAAGRAERMGCCKQLLPLGNRPAIVRCIETLRTAGIDEIVVVTGGPWERAVRRALAGFPVTLVTNPDQAGDMASSIRCGSEAIPGDTTGIIVFPPDHPLVTSATCLLLLQHHARLPGRILIPACRGRRGHPPLIPEPFLREFARYPTLRHLVTACQDAVVTVETGDEGVLLDMDTPEEYARLRGLATAPPSSPRDR